MNEHIVARLSDILGSKPKDLDAAETALPRVPEPYVMTGPASPAVGSEAYVVDRIKHIQQAQDVMVQALKEETLRSIDALTTARNEIDSAIKELRRREEVAIKSVLSATSFLDGTERFAADTLQLVPNYLGAKV